MKKACLLSLLIAAGASALATSTNAAVTVYAEYLLGEAGSLGTNNVPQDSSGNGRHFTNDISGVTTSVGGPGAVAGSTAFLDTSSATNEGFYSNPGATDFSSLANDNVAIGVYAKASSLAGNTGTIFGTGPGGGLDLSLAANGWAGSLYNVTWVGPAGGAGGSFTADTWAHLALIRAGGVTTFYIDGVAQAGTVNNVPVNSQQHLSVMPGGAFYFSGGIDEARAVIFDPGESTTNVLNALQGIPEPSTAAFLALGCLGLIRRRR